MDIYIIDAFLDKLFSNIRKAGLDVNDLELDHIAYRCDTIEEYESMKSVFSESGEMVSEKIISNRPIAVFRLNVPIAYDDRSIPAIELVSPRSDKAFIHGFEHAEFVITEELHEFRSRYPDHDFEESFEKKHNKELVLGIGDGLSVKFHNRSLLEVIRIEDITGEIY